MSEEKERTEQTEEEFDIDILTPDEEEDFFDRKCDDIESALQELGLELALDENGLPYGRRGMYFLEKPLFITVGENGDSQVRMTVILFYSTWEDEDFDADHFFETVSKRCFSSIQLTDKKDIEFRMRVPEVPMEMFREVMKAVILSCLDISANFERLYRSYRDLYC